MKSETLYTKRKLASLAAKIFDPIGLISPFTVGSKLLLQRLWTQGVGGMMSYRKKPLGSGFSGFKSFQNFNSFTFQEVTVIGLKPDASEVAYATAIYIRVAPKEGKASTSLVMSKTRVAPVRKITSPSLRANGCSDNCSTVYLRLRCN